ncbi:tyrosine-type recombinase/integrase [Methylocella sp.]|uniref:tyrosine-type recombinase/integrase n=1 Tax=Methylocella sp. TaxID=1978226 RepID=UPI0035B124A0
MAYFTAARRASIETLHVAQVALESGRITLRKAGERTTTKRRPIVPVHSRLKPTLERLVAGAGTHKGYLFPQPVDFYRPFHKLCEAQGIGPERANPHVLRHSRATHLLMHGVSIYDVERLLGDSVATVERVYGHHCPDHLAAVIDDES